MIRLLVDHGNAPAKTGIGIYGRCLVNALQRFASDEITVTESRASIMKTSYRPFWRVAYMLNLRSLASADFNGAHMVHFTNVYVPRNSGSVPLITTIHDLDAIIDPVGYPPWYPAYFRYAINTSLKRADIIFTVSKFSKNVITSRFRIEENRIKVLNMGLPQEIIETDQRSEQAAGNELPYFLFVGRLSMKKNTPWLIRTFVRGVSNRKIPKMQLLLAGNAGYGMAEIKREMAKGQGLVKWIDAPDVTTLAALYKGSSALFFPSRTEGFGTPLLEAMYFDKPIIASNIPTSKEIASGACYFFELDNEENFYDAVTHALEDTNHLQRRQFIAERLPQYRWEYLVNEYVAAYKEVQRS